MAHEKVTDRPTLAKGNVATNDVLHVVDVSDNAVDADGNSKQATVEAVREAILTGANYTTEALREVLATTAAGEVTWTHITEIITADYINDIVDDSDGDLTVAMLTGPTGLIGDLNGDGQVGASDLLAMLAVYGDSGPPSQPVRVDWETNTGGYTTVATSDTPLAVSPSYNATVMAGHSATIDTANDQILTTKPTNLGNHRTQKLTGTIRILNTAANVTVEVKGIVTKTNTAGDTQSYTKTLFAGILEQALDVHPGHTFTFDEEYLSSNTRFGSPNPLYVTDIDVEIKANYSGEGTVSVRIDEFEAENT